VAEFERRADVVWEGSLAEGSGRVSSDSGALRDLPVSWPARVEEPDGTSPEELVAAAHATCYAMALSHTLAQGGTPPERLAVSAIVSGELGDAGLAVKTSELNVSAFVPGLDQAEFDRRAHDAERNCPISNALRGAVEIRLNATLES
jgi:osmotically inducible protein OsmC